MSKEEFMRELERLLANVPDNERIEALNYYEEYFSDAGEENWQKVIEELESPAKVAETIKDGLRANMDTRDSAPGSGYNSASQSGAAYQNGTSYQGSTIYQGNTFYQNTAPAPQKEGMPAWAIVLIVLGCILLSPALLGLACTLLGVLAAVFFSCIGLILGFGGAGIGLIVGGIAMVVMGIADLFFAPMAGMLLSGTGLILLAIGMLLIMFTVWLCGWALPSLCKGVAWLFKKVFKESK